jgi:hypothetical protein
MKKPETILTTRSLLLLLLTLPAAYVCVAYTYLAIWHGEACLWNRVVHENGRLTLLGSIFYFDHFLGCTPMVLLFALCIAGTCSVRTARVSPAAEGNRRLGPILVGAAGLFFILSLVASLHTVGWQRTFEYFFQSIERDGVTSKGGNWNQLLLSNIPISLGAIAVCNMLVPGKMPGVERGGERQRLYGFLLIVGAAVFLIGLTSWSWPGWSAFWNTRWLGHSLRELATYPLTGVPVAVAAVIFTEYWMSGVRVWVLEISRPSIILISVASAIAVVEWFAVRQADVLAVAQRPHFAPAGLSIGYLLSSHVFEHSLDVFFLGVLSAACYALVRGAQRIGENRSH